MPFAAIFEQSYRQIGMDRRREHEGLTAAERDALDEWVNDTLAERCVDDGIAKELRA